MIDQERIARILRPVLLGFDPEQRDSLERAFEAIVGEVSTASKPDAEPRVRIESIVQANPRSYLRLKPPPLGQSLQLPAPRRCQAGDWVEVSIEAPEGTLRVVALPYDEGARGPRINATVNGTEFATFLVSGFVRFVTNGDDRWSSSTEFPAESAAAQRIATTGAIGATGADGEAGVGGPPGGPGPRGYQGERGYPGARGASGAAGHQGPPGMPARPALPAPMIPGVAGPAGLIGRQGPPGRDGMPGRPGAPGPAGAAGAFGSAAAHTFIGNITGSPAIPTGNSLATLAGDYLTYNSAGGINWAGAGILDNAGGVLGTQGQILQGLDSATITENWAFSVDTAALRYDVNQAADFTWTGDHSFVGTGTTFNVNVDGALTLDTAANFALAASSSAVFTFGAASSMSVTGSLDVISSSDITLDADADVFILGSGILQVGDGVIEGYVRMQASTSSAPSVSSNEGMFWAFDPGAPATLPYFTDDANVDRQILTHDALPVVSGNGEVGSTVTFYRTITAGGAGVAGDTVFFSANAPWAMRIIASGVDVVTGSGVGDTVTLRNATGGGGSALSSAMSTATSGTIAYSAGYTGVATVAAGGSVVARWTDRAAVGTFWFTAIRTG